MIMIALLYLMFKDYFFFLHLKILAGSACCIFSRYFLTIWCIFIHSRLKNQSSPPPLLLCHIFTRRGNCTVMYCVVMYCTVLYCKVD